MPTRRLLAGPARSYQVGGVVAHGEAKAEKLMTVLLSVQGLTKGFGPRPLFTDLSLEIRAGQRVGLIGPNGSGKSTLLRLLAALDEPDSGSRSLRRTVRFGYLSQDDTFAPGLTVRDALLAALDEDHLE
jgi:ATP-binding cassette subfamily F protein uup